MKLGEKQELFTRNVAKLIIYAEEQGFKCRMREVQRPRKMQEIYIAEGKSKTMNSKHINSLAVDMYFTLDGELLQDKESLQFLGDYWENLTEGNSWGGNWTSFLDTPHFEYGG